MIPSAYSQTLVPGIDTLRTMNGAIYHELIVMKHRTHLGIIAVSITVSMASSKAPF